MIKLLPGIPLYLMMLVGTLAAPPLDKTAKAFARKLPAGILVLGEQVDGSITYAEAGHPEPEGVPPEQRIFEIGSITKVFTGLLLALAVEEGKVRLDTPIGNIYGPGFTFADPNVAKITLEQLSTHTSGLPRLPFNLKSTDDDPNPYVHYRRPELDQCIARVALSGPGPHPAAYSNLGVGLLGELLGQVYGKSWETLVLEKIITPLGMKDTGLDLSQAQSQRLAPPYEGKEAASEWTFRAIAGAGALRSTAADLMRFGNALLAPEETPFPKAIREMMRAHAPYSATGNEIGLGIIISREAERTLYFHTGGTGGFKSVLQVIPEQKIIRVGLVNNSSFEPIIAVASRSHVPPAADEAVSLTPEEIDAFIGVYQLSASARFTLFRREGKLYAGLTGQAFVPYQALKGDRFYFTPAQAELKFHREGGRITSLTLRQYGQQIPARRIQDTPDEGTLKLPKAP